MTLLSARGLVVELGGARPVDGVDLDLSAGQTLALVGESGSGKSLTARALLNLLPNGARLSGSVRFQGEELIGADAARWRRLRGAGIGLVFQDPKTALDPVYTIGQQLLETWAAHDRHPKKERRDRAIALLAQVGIPAPERRIDDYPHQLSGGMRQRVLIALALMLEPQVLICDEPTSALDVTVQAQILELLLGLQAQHGMAMLFITHDLAVVHEWCPNVAVMYAGRLVETGPTAQVLANPRHPYTRGLLDAVPRVHRPLAPIPGAPPSLRDRPPGCTFAPRCPSAQARCSEAAPPLVIEGPRSHRCLFPLEVR
ncbi:MAG: ABC transporter ATP-binding protein [Deltaproteobacteria bacterium]|nr:ABC transporter ATP-binding protein [Deltaproteobacteria bacterium]